MPHRLHEVAETIHDLREALSEDELLAHNYHQKLGHWLLLLRNIAVAAAMILFLASILHAPASSILKAIAYFLGAGAYFCEILMLTDCFRTKVPHREMFMAYCFGPMYILLGISYLAGH